MTSPEASAAPAEPQAKPVAESAPAPRVDEAAPAAPQVEADAPVAAQPEKKKPASRKRAKTSKPVKPAKAKQAAASAPAAELAPAPAVEADAAPVERPSAQEAAPKEAPEAVAPASAEPVAPAAPAEPAAKGRSPRKRTRRSQAAPEPAAELADLLAEAAPAPAAPAEPAAPAAERASATPAPEALAAETAPARSESDTPTSTSVNAPIEVSAAPADATADPAPTGSRRASRSHAKRLDEMTIDELIEMFPRKRRGRPSKQEAQVRGALKAAKADPSPESLAQARAIVAAALGEPAPELAPMPSARADRDGKQADAPESPTPQAAEEAAAEGTAEEGAWGTRRRHHDRRDRSEGQQGQNGSWQKGDRPARDRDRSFDGQRSRDNRDARDRDNRDRQRDRDRSFEAQRPRDARDNRDAKPGFNLQGNNGQNQQFGAKNNRKNERRGFSAEPKVKREELEELKVGDLRAKATELDIDPAGLKKPELVDAVYSALVKQEGFFEFTGILDIANEGHGYVRTRGYLGSEHDVYVGASAVRANALRRGDEISGIALKGRPNDKYPGVTKITAVNGKDPEEARNRPRFGDLTPIFPSEPLKMEHGRDSILGRCIDLVSPIGKGQRGLIVSPPKAGKTTVLKKIAESIAANNPEVHLICLLVDERPEEVTDMQRSIRGEVVASTFDMPCDNHITVAELVIERAKRLVEMGQDVVILLDSITRLARAYNLAQPASGRILSGGVDSTALYPPKRFLGAARNIENGGSLTILASALVDTGSKMDEVIFEEFKGTGNMELKLDRDLADRRIFPAIDPVASGTRKEELLLDSNIAPFVWGVRRILANMNSNERAMTSLIKSLKATQNNEEFLIMSAKKAQMRESNGMEL